MFYPPNNPKLSAALNSTHTHPPGSPFSISSTNYTIFNFLEISHYLKMFTPETSSNIPPSPVKHLNFLCTSMYFLYIFGFLTQTPPQTPPYFLNLKPQENSPCPLLDQHFTFSLKIMTLPRILTFGILTPRTQKISKKTGRPNCPN